MVSNTSLGPLKTMFVFTMSLTSFSIVFDPFPSLAEVDAQMPAEYLAIS